MNKSTEQVKPQRVKGDPRAGREEAGDAGNRSEEPRPSTDTASGSSAWITGLRASPPPLQSTFSGSHGNLATEHAFLHP